ncbi:MAG: hypothetical protein WC538_21735 [Thermoanaerobaculia bacterium]|jgi:hypothetical protein
MRPLRNLLLALVSLALLAASWLAWRDDRTERGKLDAFAARYDFELRRADDVATMRLEPQADLGAVIAASMTLDDVYGSVRLKDLDSATRAAWLRSVATTGNRVDDAIERTLDAIVRRPGWSFHQSMLAQLAYTKSRRESPGAVARDAARWELPALAAIRLAPGNLSVRAFLGGAYLETWDRITTRQLRRDALRAAMRSPAFVERSYGAVASLAGSDEAVALLPNDMPVLRIAFAREAKGGRVDAAAAIRSRLDAAILQSRAEGLERIELLARRRDRYGLATEIPAWLSANRLGEIDTAAARRQVARVAELVPPMRRGRWPDDPRARLLGHLLDGRASDADGASLARLAESLSAVPDPVAAAALAEGGEPFAARELLLASDSRGAFEWTPAIVAIARAFLKRGDVARARAILEELAPTARDECDALLVLRDASAGEEREALAARLAAAAPRIYPAGAWSRSGSLALCVEPATMSRATLHVTMKASQPALVSWGWSNGRAGSFVVHDAQALDVPLSGFRGRLVFSIRTDAGGPVELGEATIR